MGRPPKITQVTHNVAEEYNTKNPDVIQVPGLVFRWVNHHYRTKRGWKIWTPVTRDSELGATVTEQLGVFADKYAGLNGTSNLFHQGEDSVLAYASVEAYRSLAESAQSMAENRINMIDAENVRRNVVIPASGKYSSQFGGGG